MNRHRLGMPLLAAAAVLCASAAADAGRARVRGGGHAHVYPGGHVSVVVVPRGLYLGVGLAGAHVLDQRGGAELLESGGGVSLFGGWRVIDRLALELGYTGTFHNPAGTGGAPGGDTDYLVLSGITGDARVYVGDSAGRAEPYLQGGVGLYLLDSHSFGTQSVGSGFQLGGGFDLHLSPLVDVGLRALYRGVAMGPPDARTEDTFISAVTGEANLTFRF